MLEILQYITSGFWVFVGSFIIISMTIPLVVAVGWALNAVFVGMWGHECGDVKFKL